VAVGAPGSGTEQLSRQLLEVHDLTYADIEPRYLSFSESSAAIRDGAVDAAILSVGYPAAAVLEASTTAGARLIPVDGEPVVKMLESYPFYTRGVIPAGVYPGLDEDLATVAAMSWIVARTDLDSSVATHLLEILRNDLESLVRVHEIAAQIDLEELSRSPIPLHEATATWLEGRD
jgi:TRAP transporter TAXI family solute receptor